MKNLKTISLATIGTLAIIGTSVFATTGVVNAPSGLVLREEASKTSNPIMEVPDKTEVNIIEKSEEWYKVTYSNQEGYLFAEYVNVKEGELPEGTPTAPSEETPTADALTDNGTSAKSKLKVYAIPVITSTVINEIEPNVEITIEKQITNWSYVSVGEISGWVRTYGIENTVQTSTEPTVEQPQENTQEPQDEQPAEKPEQGTQTEEPTVTEEPEEKPEEQTTTAKPSNQQQTEQTVAATKGVVAVECANVRKEAATDSEIITALTKDTSFTITAETEEWYKIKYTSIDGVVYEGYIFKSLVTK